MRKVRDIMSAAPVCMAPGESVSAAVRAMKQHGIGTVLLLTDGKLSGLVTDRDITVRVLAENRDPRSTRIGDIYGGELVVLGPDDDLAEACPAGPRPRGAPHPGAAGRDPRRRRVRRRPRAGKGRDVGMTGTSESIVRELLARHGRLYAEDAGIKLADRPGPLYQLLVLATLLSAPIPAETAVAAASELFAAGYRSPKAMSEASWQDRVDALGRGHYRRYDERSATMLGDGAELLVGKWHGDLRRLRDDAGGEADGIASRLTEFPGVGPTGASIFLREVQEVWPSVAPYVDAKVTSGAHRVRLPADRESLAGLLAASGQPARLAAALVRVSLSQRAASEVTASVRD